MTDSEYFSALRDLLVAELKKTVIGETYEIAEPKQEPFKLSTRNLPKQHLGIQPEKLPPSTWLCFKTKHKHAHKKCDCIVVSWDQETKEPQYLLIELKSKHRGEARLQLQASLAFCHFVHRMVCINTKHVPNARFAAVTVKQLPIAQKLLSRFHLPEWDKPPLRDDCPHMTYDRTNGTLPVAPLMGKF